MKTALTILTCILFLSCNNETTPFEKSISKYVKSKFNEPESYEKISISVIDTVTVAKKIKIYESHGMSHEELDSEPKDKFLYYTVSHKYRAKNSFGAKVIFDDIVSMDKDYNITGSHGVD